MLVESNPFWWPTYVPAVLLALVAGCLPIRPRSYLVAQVVLLCAAAVLFHTFLVRSVVWTYEHPFNPDDGGPKTMASLFGWLIGLLWPILPTYAATRFLRWVIYASRRSLRDGTTI